MTEALPARALLAPAERILPFEYRDGCAHVSVTVPDDHAMVVFE